MKTINQGQIRLSPTLLSLLDRIDKLLDIRTIHHEYLDICLPKGILFSSHLSDEIKLKGVILKMGVIGSHLEATFSLQVASDCSKLIVETLSFNQEAGESSYAIKNVALSPKDVHMLVSYLVSEFCPYSLSITESE